MSINLQETLIETVNTQDEATVSQIIEKLVKQKGIKFSDATKAVYVEWKKGTLSLSSASPPTTPLGHLFNLQNAWFWAVTALIATSVISIFTVQSTMFLYVRYALGAAFILFLPGSLLVCTLYPNGRDLNYVEKAALSIGLSLAVVPLVSLILNYTPWGIRLEPIVVSMSVLVEALAVVYLLRRYRHWHGVADGY